MMYREALESALKNLARQRLEQWSVPQNKLSIVWWNTSLDSYKIKKNSEKEAKSSKKILEETLESICKLLMSTDLLVLGEYTDRYGLRKYISELNLCLSNASSKMRFDMIDLNYSESYINKRNKKCTHEFHNIVIYKMGSLTYLPEEKKCVTCNKIGKKYYRVYQCVKFLSQPLCDKALEVFVVHWSMHDTRNRAEENRNKYDAAAMIRSHMRHDEKNYPYQIVVGDFNCEMYEEPFAKLESSRSVKFAARNDGLYNPFWRCLGDDVGSISDMGNQSFLCDEPFFDGILVNRSFIAEEGRVKLFPSVLNEINPFKSGNHRPLQLIISK